MLESANCGFAVISALPDVPEITTAQELDEPGWTERYEAEEKNKQKLSEYRKQLETLFIDAIRQGLLEFCMPEDRVLDYTDTVRRVEFVKGRVSKPVAFTGNIKKTRHHGTCCVLRKNVLCCHRT